MVNYRAARPRRNALLFASTEKDATETERPIRAVYIRQMRERERKSTEKEGRTKEEGTDGNKDEMLWKFQRKRRRFEA